ncbi:hypothetical protein EYC84_003690 [Monilinia fructicola]|uniref:Uncharacterized protein n=1 Tax=Monilinia fructicola TaxID=38448 RepID=A0A5M9JVE7_MONFR|nr:hypothetical protein EYC84_003690 [Monilinia fructicola]
MRNVSKKSEGNKKEISNAGTRVVSTRNSSFPSYQKDSPKLVSLFGVGRRTSNINQHQTSNIQNSRMKRRQNKQRRREGRSSILHQSISKLPRYPWIHAISTV